MHKETINGKPILEVMKALQKDFDLEQVKNHSEDLGMDDKEWLYAPLHCYQDRLDEVLSPWNYDISYEEASVMRLVQIGEKEGGKEEKKISDCYSVKCRIVIYTDEKKVVCVREGYGISRIYATSLAGNLGQAQAAAFKNCCKLLGVGGDIKKIWRSGNPEKPKKEKRSSKAESIDLFVIPCGRLESFMGGKHYSILVKVQQSGEERKLIFWEKERNVLLQEPSQRGKANRWEDISMIWATSKVPLRIIGQCSVYNNELRINFQGLKR